jgi:hypothetical protein
MFNQDDFLSQIQRQTETEFLAKEQVYNQLRQSGEEAPAVILSMMDTGVRIGDTASMLRFNLEVHPKGRPAFRADTQNSISDLSRPKFAPGATIYVKFDPRDTTQVAVDHAPVETARPQTIKCPSCGAVQEVSGGQSACIYCGGPLSA